MALQTLLAVTAAGASALAGTITFLDSPGTLSVVLSADILARGSTSTCTPGAALQSCSVTLLPPTGVIGGGGFTSWTILDQLSNLISDEIRVTPAVDINFNLLGFSIDFLSHDPGVSAPAFPLANILRENGTVQTAGSVFWANGSSDSISFQSTDATPEPGVFLLVGTGLAALGLRRKGGALFSRNR